MKTILVTGGCGYIGSHTVVALQESGYEVISIDNNSRSHDWITERIEQITNIPVKNYALNLCNKSALETLFEILPPIDGIIHFAAYKAVGESVNAPLLYYQNNLLGMMNILEMAEKHSIPNFVFSSSCTVYGSPESLPVTENSPLLEPESPYGKTKSMGESILRDLSKVSNINFVSLRYFNPVGAHETALIGELPLGVPDNLVPYITQTAIGKRNELTIFGGDYPTRDGTCVRDYVHVCDIADAHVKAIDLLLAGKTSSKLEIFNLGTGHGVSVLEAVEAFIKVSKVNLNYKIGPRRPGDVVEIYADNQKAMAQLGWKPKYGIDEMMKTAWKWEKRLVEQVK